MSDLFDEKSRDWDKNEIVLQLSNAIGSAIVDDVALHENIEVMDFGAGTGLISSHVAPRVKRITAVDVSQAMLDQLKKKSALQGKVEIVCQDILQAPLEQKFDLIISAMAMHHVEETALLAQRFFQHLKPNGQVALADLDTEDGSFHEGGTEGVFHSGFDRTGLGRIFTEQGFEKVQFQTAHVVEKQQRYPVFLLTARKP